MRVDPLGLPIATTSDEAAAAFGRALLAYAKNRAGAADPAREAARADPHFALAHVLRGYFAMLAFNAGTTAQAEAALAAARPHLAAASARERAHAVALEHWSRAETGRAVAVWEEILAEHPRDLLAFRLHHFASFWRGRADHMARAVAAVQPHYSPALPGWSTVLACRAFALEECGQYLPAEIAGREAIAHDQGDLWAAHAVAHVMEMQGRRGEGIAWLASLEPHWEGGNNLKHHLWWHRALYHLERREFDAVLALHDGRYRDLAAPLVQAMPDLYIDVQNAASMLFRLELRGVDVGARWQELADKAEARVGDCLSAFTLPHWMMALAATGRERAAAALLAAVEEQAQGQGAHAALLAEVALPVCRAVLLHRQGRPAEAVATMRPVLGEMQRMGASHAQQDVLEQLFLDAAMKAGLEADARTLLERVAARHPTPPGRRLAYAEAARALRF